MRRKVKTGIDGLDDMLLGGLPEMNQVVVAGGPGTGKTLFGFEFLYKGAKLGEPGVLIPLEETPEMIIDNAKSAFTGFSDIDKLIKDNTLCIYDTLDIRSYLNSREDQKETFARLVSEIEEAVQENGAKRVVFDSLSLLKLLLKGEQDYRSMSMDLVGNLRRMKLTSVLTTEIDVAEKSRMYFLPEFFFYDGIITMYSSGDGGANRALTMEVIKMRGTSHSRATVPYEITTKGMDILSLAQRGKG
ncbi:MAG: hypothetical protein KGH64_03235 [Candidatus Micrarchaeota archaeon]|nr:hypothetical protein [Candidatus Micrarchaeota archaeon]MDE1834326.1 hypothetical protein [Candidatus Micrarchaeota archaeon]MDE1859103.1 hypothetical protein [Candidatus Micrarchaeota archaeon]